jgi:hypothetical protein
LKPEDVVDCQKHFSPQIFVIRSDTLLVMFACSWCLTTSFYINKKTLVEGWPQENESQAIACFAKGVRSEEYRCD